MYYNLYLHTNSSEHAEKWEKTEFYRLIAYTDVSLVGGHQFCSLWPSSPSGEHLFAEHFEQPQHQHQLNKSKI